MTALKSILTISRDDVLQNTRTLILQRAGYHVSPARSDQEALDLIEASNSFTLVLLCHSVPEPSRVLLVARMKELKPKLPVLMLYNGYDPTEAKVDGSVHNLDSPAAMLDMIGFLMMKSGG